MFPCVCDLLEGLFVSFDSYGCYPVVGEPRVNDSKPPVVCFTNGVSVFLDDDAAIFQHPLTSLERHSPSYSLHFLLQ